MLSEYLRMVDSRLGVFNRVQSPSRCLSHLLPLENCSTLAYVLEDIAYVISRNVAKLL